MLCTFLEIVASFLLRSLITATFFGNILQIHSIHVVNERIVPAVSTLTSSDHNHTLSKLADSHTDPSLTKNYDNYEDGMRIFTDYKLARIIPRDKKSVAYLRELFLSENSLYKLDFWQPPSRVGAIVDVTVTPEDARSFFRELDSRNMEYFIISDNLQSLIINERTSAFKYDPSTAETSTGYHYDRYNPLTTIEAQIFRLRDENPNLVTIFDIGKTHENRSIYTVKVSSHATRKHPWRSASSALWIDGGIHAREWIAPATAMNLLRKLINGYNTGDQEYRNLLESNDWYVTPVLNPDGYEYSHTKNRMWRKNRRPADCRSLSAHSGDACCAGVDLNRNFDWHFADSGSSNNPCHEVYHGPGAFSEPESRAVRDFIQKVKVQSFITLHSYSQLWLIPFGHKRQTYPNDFTTNLRPLSLRATKAMARLYGTKYAVGTGADLLYEASGASHDYAKGVLKVPFSFLIELRPQNGITSNGFLLPESEIMATGEETWMAVKVVAEEVINKFGRPITPKPEPVITTTLLSTTTMTTTTEAPAVITTTEVLSTEISPITKSVTVKRPASGGFHKRTFRPKNKTTPSSNEKNETTTITRPSPGTVAVESHATKPLGSSEVELFFMIGVRTGKQIDFMNTSQELPKNLPQPTLTSRSEIVQSTASTDVPPVTATTSTAEITTGSSSDGLSTRKTIICHDFSHYCKWWKIHGLCERPQVQQKCTLSCLKECQI